MVQPGQSPQLIGEQPVTVVYEPLRYHVSRHDEQLVLQIENPTANPVNLVGQKSYVVDPAGESRPIRGRSIAPHSYVQMRLPPTRQTMTTYGYGPGYYGPYGPYWYYPYGPYYYPYTYAQSFELVTPYDWKWQQGDVRLQLSYSYQATSFEHQFLFSKQWK